MRTATPEPLPPTSVKVETASVCRRDAERNVYKCFRDKVGRLGLTPSTGSLLERYGLSDVRARHHHQMPWRRAQGSPATLLERRGNC